MFRVPYRFTVTSRVGLSQQVPTFKIRTRIRIPEGAQFSTSSRRCTSSRFRATVTTCGVGLSWFILSRPKIHFESTATPPPPPIQEPRPRSPFNVYELSFGTVSGICTGIFIKKGAKALAFLLGGVFVLLQYLHSLSFIKVDWNAISARFDDSFSSTPNALGERNPATISKLWKWIVDFLVADFQPRASFLAGLLLGLRPVIMSIRPLQVVFHVAAASVMAYGWISLINFVPEEWIEKQVGGHLQFLTIQSLAVSWATTVLGLIAHLLPSSAGLFKAKRMALMISLPLAVVVSIIYWTLLLLSPKLIIQATKPTSTNSVPVLMNIPLSVDLALHVLPACAIIAQFYCFEDKYSEEEAIFGAPFIITVFSSWYIAFAEYCAYRNGFFPYPFLTSNALHVRAIIYIVVMSIAIVAFWMLNEFHSEPAERTPNNEPATEKTPKKED